MKALCTAGLQSIAQIQKEIIKHMPFPARTPKHHTRWEIALRSLCVVGEVYA